MAGGVDRGGIQPTMLHKPSTVGLDTEADVELKVVTPLLTGANFLAIPITWITILSPTSKLTCLAPSALIALNELFTGSVSRQTRGAAFSR